MLCVAIGVSGDGIGRAATRAKALNLSNGLKVRGWHSLGGWPKYDKNVFRRPIRSPEICRNSW